MSNKTKYTAKEYDLTVRNGNRMPICACSSLSGARKIARALNTMEAKKPSRNALKAMEAKPKAKPFAFDWSGVPDKYKWAAMDLREIWYAYEKKPNPLNEGLWSWENRLMYPVVCPPYPGDWRNSLQERPTK